MPELPDLVHIQKTLEERLPGCEITGVEISQPVIIRMLVAGGFAAELTGARFKSVRRHGPFLTFGFDRDLELIVHPMLAGRFRIVEQGGRTGGRGLCVSLHLSDGAAFQYLDNKRMGKVYLAPVGEYVAIPRYTQQGVDILSGEFNADCFRELIRGRRHQVRVFLMDQTALSAIGNAYADEVLFEAGLHPKTLCTQLHPGEVDRLYDAIVRVIDWGINEVAKSGALLEGKARGHMRVRGRKGTQCPKCGTTIRAAGVRGFDSCFCPACQPLRRKMPIDWRKLPSP